MDLRLLAAEPNAEEREAIDAVGEGGRDLLLPALRAAQRRVGWVTEGALGYASRRLHVPPADAYGVASFYHLIALEERPPDVTHVCTDLACALAGARLSGSEPQSSVHPPTVGAGSGLSGSEPQSLASPCLGLCERAPAALRTISGAEPREIQLPADGPGPRVRGPLLDQRGGALARARELGPDGVLRAVTESGLLGRGGAAFPTGRKWEAVARQPARPHYLVCNGDESEPGTFKDRVLMEELAPQLVEAIEIAAYATGCERAFLYVRAEYPLAHERLREAIAGAELEIELRIGAGAYVCGEETALFQSIEGYRGEPRNKPPFPVEVGLFGKPTVVNNVETLLNVPLILTGEFADTRLFCVSGHVGRPGLYELPLGTPLPELLRQAGAEPPQAVLLGGAAGRFLGPDELDIALDFDAGLGSGVVMVFGESADLRAAIARIADFFREESCGQCVPCRVGTVRQVEALRRDDREALADLAQVMRDASICGLGQTAANAVQSGLALL